MAAPGEKYFALLPPRSKPFISHGLAFEKACVHHAENTFHASRIYIVVSRSISKTETFTTLRDALGDKVIGVRYGILPHTPWEDVFALTEDLKAKNVDLIITLGAGSISDGVKLARLFAANNVKDLPGVDALYEKCTPSLTDLYKPNPSVKSATIPCINIPTSLSAAESTAAGAGTNMKTYEKRNLVHESMFADIVVCDPAVTLSTPRGIWLSSGVRAVDHCVEGLYATLPDSTAALTEELRGTLRGMLVGLARTRTSWEDDLDARLRTQLGALAATKNLFSGVGASHGIGHQLGPMGVGHGETSCVVLPFVLRYNWEHGDETVRRQLRLAASAFWDEPVVVEALGLKIEDRDSTTPGDLVAAFVSWLGLPRSLGQFGIGEDKFDVLAENSMRDPCTLANPVTMDKEKVIEVLKMAA
ncbi:hypothetical protein M426DRAFT_6728 [Hypoxylon sp. CI-4A]|nr:hypothetical protein M426DRAFT_6728 [Hypoxylon sp. CI-4A]